MSKGLPSTPPAVECLIALILSIIVVSLGVGRLAAETYPHGPNGEPPTNPLSGSARVLQRWPVYRIRNASLKPFFYLPRNSTVNIEGKFKGWGIFSTFRAPKFLDELIEATPSDQEQYGWVRLDGLHWTDKPDKRCPNIPPKSSDDIYYSCGGTFHNVSETDVVALRLGYALKGGQTIQRTMGLTLDACITACRDKKMCSTLFYDANAALCETAQGGSVLDSGVRHQAQWPTIIGVKLGY